LLDTAEARLFKSVKMPLPPSVRGAGSFISASAETHKTLPDNNATAKITRSPKQFLNDIMVNASYDL
jgi:hypothetical protein